MEFEQVTIPSTEPKSLAAWYERFGTDAESDDSSDGATHSVQLGTTSLNFERVADPPPTHVAFRLRCEREQAVDWLAERATILPVDGSPSRWFEFLEAAAIYFDDPEGNVLEGLWYEADSRQERDSTGVVDGITEVGLPARDPLSLVEWLETQVGLSAWGTPSETFAWVGDRNARFVVIPVGRTWYPTDREAALGPISVTVVDNSARAGRHRHPTLPYEIRITHE